MPDETDTTIARPERCRTFRNQGCGGLPGAASISARRRRLSPRPPTSSRSTPPACAGSTSSAPARSSASWLEEHFDFHALDLEDVLSRNQRPKIDVYDDYLFIVLHFPVFDPAAGRLGTGELDLFVGPGYLVTIPNQPLQPVEYLFERCRAKEELREQLFSRGSGYLLYRLVDDSFDYCFPMLRKIGNKLDALEDDIFEGALGGGRPRHLQRQAGDHQLPQGDPPAAAGAPANSRRSSSATWRPTSTSRSTSTTSSTPTSGSGTCSRTTRRWSRRWPRPTSR